MPDPNLQVYLAQHYLSGPKADAILARQQQQQQDDQKKKKRKKKRSTIQEGGSGTSSSGQGLRLRDEADDWKRTEEEEADDTAQAQVVREEKRGKFHKGRWASLGADGRPAAVASPTASIPGQGEEEEEQGEGPQLVGSDGLNLDATAAQLAEAQKGERQARQHAQESTQAGPSSVPQQPISGLRTKEQVRADRLAREEAQRREQDARLATGSNEAEEASQAQREARLAQTTVYRDERGRRIDVEAEDELIRREEERKRHKEREKKQWNKGERQKEEERNRQRDLEKVKHEGVARYATDARMNSELRAMERADDPALAFLTKKRIKGPQLPKYKGPPPPPNRFGIPPGHRWDGVDRGNGFEKKLFEARGARVRREQDERAYGTSDM